MRPLASALDNGFERFFASLSSYTVDRLCRNSTFEVVPAKTILFKSDTIPNSLLVLGNGVVQLFQSGNGREINFLIVESLACLNTAFVLNGTRLPVSARAIESSSILSIPAVVVRRMFSTDGTFRQLIVDDLTFTQSIILRELVSLRTETTFERLKDWVVAAIREAEYAISIDLPYGKSLLASRLGMAPETLSRNLARLEKSGVHMEERKLRITNLEKFRQLAGIDPAQS
jgi:CRP/FNR family transcriptional regulator, transcriptional activator FtrB